MFIASASNGHFPIGMAARAAGQPDMRSVFAAMLAGQRLSDGERGPPPAHYARMGEIIAAPAMPSRPPEHSIDRRRKPSRNDESLNQQRQRGDRRRPNRQDGTLLV